MTNKSIPRIGRQKAQEGLIQLIKVVNFEQPIPEDHLREKMQQYNENRETDIFQDVDELISFVRDDKSSSIQILSQTEDGYVLNEVGQNLLYSQDIDKALFTLMTEKSRTEFVYFWEVIQELDRMYEEQDYLLGTSLIDSINGLFESGSNTVTAGTIGGLLLDFGIIERDDEGYYKLNPAEYTYLREGKYEILLNVIEGAENERLKIQELTDILVRDYEWSENEVYEIVKDLKSEGLVQTDRYEGKHVVERVRY